MYRRREVVKTTWTFRLVLPIAVVALASLTRGLWAPVLGRALVCQQNGRSGDAILIENFDMDYVLYRRAAELLREGAAARVVVPTEALGESTASNPIWAGIAQSMARHARLPAPEMVPVKFVEPISLNAAYQVRDYLQKEAIQSVIVVAPAFRSQRSALIYEKVLGERGIASWCVPVFGPETPETWAETWSGFQLVSEQYIKLEYYRHYVLPELVRRG